MNNISLNQEPINLIIGNTYIVIDALYINDINSELHNLKSNNIFVEIKDKVFPYTDTPFCKYIPDQSILTIDMIKKIDNYQIEMHNLNAFSTDTGVIIFINERIFIEFILNFNYNELVHSNNELLNIKYWSDTTSKFNIADTAIIVAPGIDDNVEFDGSGLYNIEYK